MGNGFSNLFKFKIDNEKSDMMICQHLTLINNTKIFWPIKNLVKSKAWLLLNYDGVSYPVLGNKIYWWNIRNVTLFYKDNKKKRANK